MSNLIFKKMSEVMKEIGYISKDQKNQAQGFKFRGIDQFVNALYPALTKHGVFMSPECVSEHHEIKEVTRSTGKTGYDKHVNILMKYHFFAEDGSSVVIGPIPAEALDSGDKATNKALSAALKYALIQTFSIPTEDMEDGDRVSPEITKETSTYLIPFGQWKDKYLHEIPVHELKQYVAHIKKKSSDDQKPLTGVVSEFVNRVEKL